MADHTMPAREGSQWPVSRRRTLGEGWRTAYPSQAGLRMGIRVIPAS